MNKEQVDLLGEVGNAKCGDIMKMFMEANEGRDLRDRGNVKAVTRTAAN